MARTNAVNFSSTLQFPLADAATDLFKKEDVQVLAKAVDAHDHTAGKGLVLGASSIPNGLITSAMIADGTIVGGDIANATITGAKIGAQTITDLHMAPQTITGAAIASNTIDTRCIVDGSLVAGDLADGAVTAYTTVGGFNNASTSSTSPVSIPGLTTTAISKPEAGRLVLVGITLTVQFAVVSQNANIFLMRDSTSIGCLTIATSGSGGSMIQNITVFYFDVGAVAGAHTWTVQWSTNQNTISLVSAAFSSLNVVDIRR